MPDELTTVLNFVTNAGVPSIWAVTGTFHQISGSIRLEIKCTKEKKVHNKCNSLESSRNHPPTPQSREKLSSMKSVSGAQKVEDH